MLCVGPFLRGDFLDLHQADFLGPPSHPGIKAALAPNHRFDQRGVHAVTMGGGADGQILAAFEPSFPPPIPQPTPGQEQGEKAKRAARFHNLFLQEGSDGVEKVSCWLVLLERTSWLPFAFLPFAMPVGWPVVFRTRR